MITPYTFDYHISIEIEISNNYLNMYEPRATRTKLLTTANLSVFREDVNPKINEMWFTF